MRTFVPSRPTVRSTGLIVAAALLAASLTGCGADAPDQPTDPATTAPSVLSPTPTPSVTPLPTPSAVATPTASEPPTSEGNGDGEDDDQPATAGGGICGELSAEEIGAALGSTVRGSGLPGGGCAFNPRDPSAPAISLIDAKYRPGTGMDRAKTDATSSVEGEPEDLTGIGQAAFVVTGTAFGGEDLQGAGAVASDGRLISLTLAQSEGLPRAQVRALVVRLLKLLVAEQS